MNGKIWENFPKKFFCEHSDEMFFHPPAFRKQDYFLFWSDTSLAHLFLSSFADNTSIAKGVETENDVENLRPGSTI